MIYRWIEGVRTLWRRWSPPPIETSVGCSVEDLERFLQRLTELAQGTDEQVTWGTLKIMVGSPDMRHTRNLTVGVSLRDGIHFIVDTAQSEGATEFHDDNVASAVALRRSVAEALYGVLLREYGAEPREDIAASIDVQ